MGIKASGDATFEPPKSPLSRIQDNGDYIEKNIIPKSFILR